MTLLCKNCKHVNRDRYEYEGKVLVTVHPGAECWSPQRPCDYVNGGPIYGGASMFRGVGPIPYNIAGREICGPEAKWFEPFAQPTNE